MPSDHQAVSDSIQENRDLIEKARGLVDEISIEGGFESKLDSMFKSASRDKSPQGGANAQQPAALDDQLGRYIKRHNGKGWRKIRM